MLVEVIYINLELSENADKTEKVFSSLSDIKYLTNILSVNIDASGLLMNIAKVRSQMAQVGTDYKLLQK